MHVELQEWPDATRCGRLCRSVLDEQAATYGQINSDRATSVEQAPPK